MLDSSRPHIVFLCLPCRQRIDSGLDCRIGWGTANYTERDEKGCSLDSTHGNDPPYQPSAPAASAVPSTVSDRKGRHPQLDHFTLGCQCISGCLSLAALGRLPSHNPVQDYLLDEFQNLSRGRQSEDPWTPYNIPNHVPYDGERSFRIKQLPQSRNREHRPLTEERKAERRELKEHGGACKKHKKDRKRVCERWLKPLRTLR